MSEDEMSAEEFAKLLDPERRQIEKEEAEVKKAQTTAVILNIVGYGLLFFVLWSMVMMVLIAIWFGRYALGGS